MEISRISDKIKMTSLWVAVALYKPRSVGGLSQEMASQIPPRIESGTQSPPLEATGSEVPMGVCSIDGTKPTYLTDLEQRRGKG